MEQSTNGMAGFAFAVIPAAIFGLGLLWLCRRLGRTSARIAAMAGYAALLLLWMGGLMPSTQGSHYSSFRHGIMYGLVAAIVIGLFVLGRCVHLIASRPHRRYPAGHCLNCGYDLRATPHRCPECGTVVAQWRPTRRNDLSLLSGFFTLLLIFVLVIIVTIVLVNSL